MAYPGTDTELVGRAIEGDPRALDQLVNESLPEVLEWCARLGGARVDPEDAAHDVMMVLITRIDRLRTAATYPYWLFGITRNVVSGHRRSAWLRRWIPGALPEIRDDSGHVGRSYELSETSRRVDEVLGRLKAHQREVLVLCDLEERTANEVSRILGIPIGTVKSRLRLARARFVKTAEELGLAPDLVSVAKGVL